MTVCTLLLFLLLFAGERWIHGAGVATAGQVGHGGS